MTPLQLEYWQISLLAVVQGITEFLPISSSAHLLLPAILLDWPDQGLTFDVAVHVGTLVAVLAYFRRDVQTLFLAWCGSLGGERSPQARLAWLLIAATIPAGIAGLLLNDWIEQYARSALVIGATSILFALLLWLADRVRTPERSLEDVGWRTALFIGAAQVLALIPGTSRSGITMTAGLLCGLGRRDAARFSFLLAIPIILASGALRGVDLLASGAATADWPLLLYAASLAAVVAYACIHFFLRLIERIGFLPFVLYRVVLGIILLGLYWLP
ncbi:MAG: undecaprenyl-diphosphate phosphatase [Pseudohongiellaceae bacterium]